MTTAALIATGASLKVSSGGSPVTWTSIAEIIDIDGPKISQKQLDASSLQSTFREYIAGLPDGGEITLTMNMISLNTQQQTLQADATTGMVRGYKIALNDAPTGEGSTPTDFAFSALVTDWTPAIKTGEKLTAAVTLKITGPVTTTWAAS